MASASSARGKNLVLGVSAITVVISALTILTFSAVYGAARLPQQMVRFALTLGLCFFLVRAQPWARWTSVALFLIAGVGSVAGSLALLGESRGAWALLAMGIAYLYCSGVLVMSGSVKAFFGEPPAPLLAPDEAA